MKAKQITAEQYLALVKLGMPVTVVSDHYPEKLLIENMLNKLIQEDNRRHCEYRATTGYMFYTLVEEEDESTADEA